MTHIGFQVKIYPNEPQRKAFESCIGADRDVSASINIARQGIKIFAVGDTENQNATGAWKVETPPHIIGAGLHQPKDESVLTTHIQAGYG